MGKLLTVLKTSHAQFSTGRREPGKPTSRSASVRDHDFCFRRCRTHANRTDHMHTCTMHAVIESGRDNQDNSQSPNKQNSPKNSRYFDFSSLYIAHVVTVAAHEKSLRRPRTAVEAIHDFVDLQGSDDTVRSANAATQGFQRNFSQVVLPKSGELKASHRDALERQRRMTITGSWLAVAGLLRCPSEPTILHTFSRPNPTAAAPTPFHMRWSCYSL